jgi:hypothetical protein
MRRPSPAMVVALIALFVALGGGAYAAFKLPKNSVGTKQLKKGAVTPPKLAKKTVKRLRGKPGPQGLPGTPGEPGTPGAPGPGAKLLATDLPPTSGTDYLELGAAGPYTLLIRCLATSGTQVTADLALAGPAGVVEETRKVSTSVDVFSESIPAFPASTPNPMASMTGNSTGNPIGIGWLSLRLSSGGQTVGVEAWVRGSSPGGGRTPGCHYSASVTPVQ